MSLPELNPLWVSVFVTVVLVLITAYYARETRKIRLESVQPNFSLRTGMYTSSGGMHGLYLKNAGGVARDVKVDIETSNNGKNLFFVPSLDYGQEIDLRVNFQQIRENKGFVKVKLKFKDRYSRNLIDSLTVNLKHLSEEKREITFQSSPKDEYIQMIAYALSNIASKFK